MFECAANQVFVITSYAENKSAYNLKNFMAFGVEKLHVLKQVLDKTRTR